jgi:hypothetical protein
VPEQLSIDLFIVKAGEDQDGHQVNHAWFEPSLRGQLP